jgi:hypothetical protein
MSKNYRFSKREDVWITILKYFEGDVLLIKDNVINELKNDKYQGETIKPIEEHIIKELYKIRKVKDKGTYSFIPPEWNNNKEIVKKKIDGMYPEEIPIIPGKVSSSEKIHSLSKKDEYKYILEQRKAYVNWINSEFYDKIIDESEDPKIKNSYQLFVKGYLSLESPFRGLLVYHGLGTGKTATSVITAEGLSPLPINTFLPASLEGNYISEIKKFASDTFNIESNNWVFFTLEEINKNDVIRKYIYDEIGIEKKIIDKIERKMKLKRKKDGEEPPKKEQKKLTLDDFKPDMNVLYTHKGVVTEGIVHSIDEKSQKVVVKFDSKNLRVLPKRLKILDEQSESEEPSDPIKKGLFINLTVIGNTDKTIFTIDGEFKVDKINKQTSTDNIQKLSDIQMKQLEIQLDFMIESKYNFIHYNPFPSITRDQIKELNIDGDLYDNILDEGGEKDKTSDTIKNLIEKYTENKKLNIDSPFKNEVIVFDEVHNFISQIKNDKGPAKLFYNWIINSKDVKIVFLSGTPTINKPSEIAYLFNMLKGSIDVYDFTIKIDGDIEDISKRLKDIFYENFSSIEQLYVRKIKGKIVVSFIKIRSNFANILEDDGSVKTIKYNDFTFEEFINQIYLGLNKFCDKSLVTPSEKMFNKIPERELNNILNGKTVIYDEEVGIHFNRRQKLFDLYDTDNSMIDLTNNEVFMEYFFDEDGNIPPRKQVLLRRMIMGLTSYYPIDRSSIAYMPEIIEPVIKYDRYSDFNITKKINIVPCFMSYEQFTRYESKYTEEQKANLKRFSRKSIYDDGSFHYFTGTRKSCNIVYNQDNKKGVDLERLYEGMNEKENFGKNLSNYSPKMIKILQNMQKFINSSTQESLGKILVYSDYKSDGGTGAFEQVLIANGYERYDHNSSPIDKLIDTGHKKLRYTFITGDTNKEINKNAFNVEQNNFGEYIQVMMISKSGAEGISLTCVRQVHIIEPFWNNVRIDQVFGRAIRRNSHIQLDEDERNVEQYLYLSVFPDGGNIKDIFAFIQNSGWNITKDIDPTVPNFEEYLLDNHKDVYAMVQKVLHIKNMSNNTTSDQMIFEIMERKYNITEKLNDIIKESSVDCLKHTTDDPILNNKCIQFSSKLQNEMAYFPGINSDELNKIDTIQLKSKKTYFIEPDTIVIGAKNQSSENIFSYYKIDRRYRDEDMRYIRENGIIESDFFLDDNKFFVYENDKYYINSKITNKFSVVQSIYHVNSDEPVYTDYVEQEKFPNLNLIKKKQYLIGHKIKYNINDKLFFMPENVHDLDIYKLYDYKSYLDKGYSIDGLPCFVLYKNKFYEST